MAELKVDTKNIDDELYEATLDIALDTAAELMVLTGSDTFKAARDLLLKSSLTLAASGAVATVAAMGTKIATAFQRMDISDSQTSAVMMVSNFLNNEAVLNSAMTIGTVGTIGAVAAMSVKSLVNAVNDISVKMDPTIIAKRQTALANAYGEIFAYGEKHFNDRSQHNIDASYEVLRPMAEKIGFEGDDKGDFVIYEWLSKYTGEPMSPNDEDAPKILNKDKRL
ncbi:hypothetical protein [Shewanella aestuarii]|uniref:Uncharacterized protein n=1 Tax=Shewanella aestuarii TaxID=1028752 RepID=A0A6G9QQW5_9GAMM|nr:hypothetical protein [Shewanella aestuarii]QIR16493.1 hypothetical protein HBH39_18630 [Shewanella aestuarii]